MNCQRLVTAFILPAVLLLSRNVASAQCCGVLPAKPWRVPLAGYPNGQLKIEFNYEGADPAKLKFGGRTFDLKKASPGSGASVPYTSGPTSAGGDPPPMPGETPPVQMQDAAGSPYGGPSPGKLGAQNQKECESCKQTPGSSPEDGAVQRKNEEVGGEAEEDQQSDDEGLDGDSERPPAPTQDTPPDAPNDQSQGGDTPEMPSPGGDPKDSRGGGNSTNGGNMEGTPASPVDVPVRMAVAQKLGAFSNGKLQTGYILLKQPGVGAPAANPINLHDYVVRLGDVGASERLFWGASWRLKVIRTEAGTTIMTENDANRTMTFDFYNDDQVNWSGVLDPSEPNAPLYPPAPYAGQVPIKQQILKMADPANKPPGAYNSGIITEVRERGVLQSTRTVWSSTVSSTYNTPYPSSNTVTYVNLATAASQYRLTEDVFPSGASIWEEWSSVRTPGSDERQVTVKQEYRRPSAIAIKAQKKTRYKLFTWGEEVIEERLVLDPGAPAKDLVTTHTFWNPSNAADPNYSRKKLTVWPDGSWKASYVTRTSGTGVGDGATLTAEGGAAMDGQDLIIHEFSPLMNQGPPSSSATTTDLDGLKDNGRYVKTRYRADYRQERQEYVQLKLVSQTLPGINSLDGREITCVFSDATHYFATIVEDETSNFFTGLPRDIYQLRENLQDRYSLTDGSLIPDAVISHTAFFRATATATETFPYYTISGGASGSDPYRVTDVLIDPERLPCRMKRTVTDRLTGNVMAEEDYVVTSVDWWGTPEVKTLLDSKAWIRNANGLPVTLTYLDGRTETWNNDVASQVTWKNDKDVVTVQVFDEFGRTTKRAVQGVAAYSYSGSLGSASLPAQQYWHVTSWSYEGRGGNILTGTSTAITTSARDGGLTGTVASTGSVSWQRTRSVETDGAGRTVRSSNALGRTDYWHYSVASGGGEIVRRSLSDSPTALFPLEVEEHYRDGAVKSVTGTAVTDTWYTYGSTADWRERKNMGFDASLTASLGVRTTETDGLGRIVKITQPLSSTETTLNSALDETRSYNNEGLLSIRQIPGSMAGAYYYNLTAPAWSGTGSATESPHRVLTSGRSADAVLDTASSSADTNIEIAESWLENSGGLWWEVTARKVGWSADTVWVTRTAVGPMDMTSGYSRVKITSLGTTEERITARIASGAVHETKHTRNGTLVGGSLLRNGLPVFVKQNGTQTKVATFSPLREPLMEPDSTSTYWVTRTINPMYGLVTQRVGPNTGETLEYYTGQDVRAGRVWKRTPLISGQGVTVYNYNAAGQITAQWGTGTYPVAYAYDEWMRQTKLTTFRSTASNTTADTNPSNTLPASEWTPNITSTTAASTVWAYPPWLNLVVSKTYAGDPPATVFYTYYPNGQLETRKGQRNFTTTYTYHVTGQLNQINYGDSGTPDVTFGWDTAGRNSSRTDGIGAWALSYEADGRLKEETTSIVGSQGRSSKWTIDSYGRKRFYRASYGSALSPQINHGYDGFGRLSRVEIDLSKKIDINYGNSSRPSYRAWYDYDPDIEYYRVVMDESAGFSSNGEMSSRSWSSFGAAYTYEQDGEIYEDQQHYDLARFNYTRSYGRVSKVTDTLDNKSWNYEYDSRSQVSKGYKKFIASPAQVMAGTQNQYAYDLIGNRTQWREGGSATLDSGLRDHYYGGTTTAPSSTPAVGNSANALNQYRSIRRPQAFDVTGTRPTGTTTVSVTVPPAAAVTPDYQQTTSGLYFRKEISHNSATNGKYSPVTVSITGSTTDSWQQYAPPAAETLGYDADGNLTSDGRWTYTWDEENRLVQMETPAQTGTNPVPGTRLVFTYDGLSRRSKKEVYNTQSGTWLLTLREHYVYDGWNLVLTARENNAATPVVKRHACYVWGPDLASRPYGRSNWQQAGGVDGLLMIIDGVNSALAYTSVDYNGATTGLGTPPADPTDDNYFPVTDHLGNVKALFKAQYGGAITPAAIIDYDAFGRELRSTGRAADIVPFHFSTKFTDPESGLNYYGYRFYDPVNGRWINRDPIEEYSESNLYIMVGNDAVNWVDLLGLILEPHPGADQEVKDRIKKAIDRIKQSCPNAKKMIKKLEVSKNTHYVNAGIDSPSATGPRPNEDPANGSNGKGGGSTVYWNPAEAEPGCQRCPEANLLHELRHAADRDSGILDQTKNPKSGVENSEEKAVRTENEFRRNNNVQERKTYDGKPLAGSSGKNPATPPRPSPAQK